MRLFTIAAATIVAGLLSAVSAHSQEPPEDPLVEHSARNVLGTDLELWFRQAGQLRQDATRKAVVESIRADGALLTTHQKDGDLARINAAAGAVEPLSVSPLSITLLQHGARWHKETGGLLDMTIGPLTHLWEEAKKIGKAPSAEEIAAARARVNIAGARIDAAANTASLAEGMRLDVDAFGKGFIIDRAVAVLRERGVSAGLVSIGGDLYALGGKSRDAAWEITVHDPRKPQDPYAAACKVLVRDRGVATSGRSFEEFTIAGQTYSHIIDPRSGSPSMAAVSVTVIAPNAEAADALATAAAVLGPTEGVPFLEKIAGLEGLFLTRDPSAAGKLRFHRTKGFRAYEAPGSATAAETGDDPKSGAGEFPADREVAVTFRVTGIGKKPYLAVWVEDSDGRLVKTLLYEGAKAKYQKDLNVYWNKKDRAGEDIRAVTMPTRPNGARAAIWDGLDHQGRRVKAGEYVVRIEVFRENFLHLYDTRVVLPCGPADAAGAAPNNAYLADVKAVCRKKGS